MLKLYDHPRRAENEDKYQQDGAQPCAICGKAVTDPHLWVHLWWGDTAVTEAEAATLDRAGDLGLYPIGADCARRYLSADDRATYLLSASPEPEVQP